MTRPHVCILYPYNYLPYSPTVLNLYAELARSFCVTILCCNPRTRKSDELSDLNIALLPTEPRLRQRLYRYALLFLRTLKRIGLDTEVRRKALKKHRHSTLVRQAVHELSPDQLIAIDEAIIPASREAQHLPVHLLSLELERYKAWANKFDVRRLRSVVIESGKRLDYLSPHETVRAFLVPVSPVYRPLNKPDTDPGSLLYCGTANSAFGLDRYLRLLSAYPGLTLTIKGRMTPKNFGRVSASFSHLLQEGRLTIDSSYTPESDMADFVSRYRIGLCFYDPDFERTKSFHVQNVNSQKVYRYVMGGVPVIANRLDGLRAVEDRVVGILLDDLSPVSIKEAIDHIESNYDQYVKNCFEAAPELSFDRHIAPFIRYLDQIQHSV